MVESVPRFCILGGGLSGLTSAFLLQRSFPLARIFVVEAAERLGGLVRSGQARGGRAFEQGFHSSVLVNKNGREALGLARLLGLDEEVQSAAVEASSRRHLLLRGRVQLFPRAPSALRYGPALLAEPLWPRGSAADESVDSFLRRRASAAVAEHLADPICRGQLAGDAQRLSVRTCFPRLWYNERRFGSVFMGALCATLPALRQRSWLSLGLSDPLLQRISAGGRLYSLRSGLGAVVDRLEQRLAEPAAARPAELLRGTRAVRLERMGAGVEVLLEGGRRLRADALVAAVPPHELARVLEDSGLETPREASGASLCSLLAGIEHESVGVVSVGFDRDVLRGRFRGAGYFAGSREQPVLGMSWDSQLFPEQGPPGGAWLTVYVGGPRCSVGGEAEVEAIALEAVRQHLGIGESPSEVHTAVWPGALPQYVIGHHSKMRLLDALRVQHLPWLQVAGPGYYGTRSVADEIVDTRKLVDSLARRFARFPDLVENEVEDDIMWRHGGGFDIQ